MFNAALETRYTHPILDSASLILPIPLVINTNLPLTDSKQGATSGIACIAPNTFACIVASNMVAAGGSVAPSYEPNTPATYTAKSKRSPSSCHDKPAKDSDIATSIFNACAPSSFRACNEASSRAVANTFHPADNNCRTNSRPMPREAPIISAVRMRFSFTSSQWP